MNEPSRDQLLGYLLGALDPGDQALLESELDHEPALRGELDRLSARVRQLGLGETPLRYEPPVGLAERTCRFVATQTEPLVTRAQALSSYDGAAQQRRMTWSDMITIAAALIIGVSLLFPAVSYSRYQSQVTGCQNQLRLIGQALHSFSDAQPDGRFPGPEASGNRAAAGMVASHLVANGLVDSPAFLCSGLSRGKRAGEFHVPSPEAVDAAEGSTLAAMQRAMGGDYGYSLGHVVDGKLQAPRNSRREQFVLAADAPSDLQLNRVSGNHRGRGQNMLYEDGHVNFVSQMQGSQLSDDPYHNREGWVAAGLDPEDAVLGASADHPLPMTLTNHPDR